jgi:hypothetical protein
VRVLDLVDRIPVGALARQIEIEVEMRICRSFDHEVAKHVRSHVTEDFIHGHEGGRSCRHLHDLAASAEVDPLIVQRLDPLPLETEGGTRCRNVRELLDVVGAEHVDHTLEAPAKLLAVIGDVREEIRGLARRSDQDAIALEAEVGRPEPDGPFCLVDSALGTQVLERTIDEPLLVQAVLVVEDVEVDPEPLQRAPDSREDRALRLVSEDRHVRVDQAVAPIVHELPRNRDQVLPLVSLLRKGGGHSHDLPVARAEGLAQKLHLAPAVVEVVLAGDLVSGRLEEAGHAVAQHGVSPVADRERARGVGRDELQKRPFAPSDVGSPVRILLPEDAVQEVVPPGLRENEVDEPRPRHLDSLEKMLGILDRIDDAVRDLPGRAPQGPRQHERDVRGKVPVLGRLRRSELHAGHSIGHRRVDLPNHALRGAHEDLLDVLAHD